jgi:hypothetical protein
MRKSYPLYDDALYLNWTVCLEQNIKADDIISILFIGGEASYHTRAVFNCLSWNSKISAFSSYYNNALEYPPVYEDDKGELTPNMHICGFIDEKAWADKFKMRVEI